MVSENGWEWALLYTGARAAPALAPAFDRRLRRIERRGRPGAHSRSRNYQLWQHWDWSTAGEEWTPSAAWKRSVVEHLIRPNLPPSAVVLEVGPGGGRWTAVLQELAARLIVVDISDRCIEVCRERFASATNMEFHVNDGRTLPFAGSQTVDVVWSFDVFVHIAPEDIRSYMFEIARVLKPRGRAVIHHANTSRLTKAWRSRMTADEFARLASEAGLIVRDQFPSWGDGEFRVPEAEDIVTIIERSATEPAVRPRRSPTEARMRSRP